MTKKKNFHGPGGKGGLMRQMAFFCRSHPYTVRYKPRQVNSHAPGDLQKNSLPGAADTEQAKGGTDLVGPDSILHDTKETEDLQV